jgi:hypothetical protein
VEKSRVEGEEVIQDGIRQKIGNAKPDVSGNVDHGGGDGAGA